MAGQVVGGAFLSSFLNVLFDRIASKEVIDLFRGERVINKLLVELKSALRSANALLNDAEEKQLRDPLVRGWLEELKEVIYEVDNVMDKIGIEVLRRKVDGLGRSANTFSHVFPAINSAFDNIAVRFEIEEILHTFKLLLDQKDFLGLEKVDRNRPLERSVIPLVEEHDVFGRDNDKKEIMKLLLSDDGTRPKISVIAIVGMGGIGKTTLAQLVYKDSGVAEHFNLKAWVTVSDEFDVFEIIKVIFEQISGSDCCDIKDPYRLQNKLVEALKGKKFLFVFDNVRNENYNLWDALKSSFVSAAHGSRIIVTTQSEIVALKMGAVRTYILQTLSDSECWDLFAKHVFNHVSFGENENSNLQEIGKKIVRKCKGLPLAVKSVADLLHSVLDPKEWRLVLKSNIWELELEDNKTCSNLQALWLSYSLLPPNLKRCFAYLSIFPKDYEFRENDRQKIILLWMAEGLLEPQNRKRAEEVGEEYLNTLISRSFFQRCSWDESVLVMHDLMHDLALLVSGGLHKISSKIRHFSYQKDSEANIKSEDLYDPNCLRTFLALPLSLGYNEKPRSLQTVLNDHVSYLQTVLNDQVLLRGGVCLRVLSLSESSITDLPDSTGNLKYLRYLDLSRTEIKTIPSSICALYNLQTLLLARCKKLTWLPTNMSSLICLRHLDVREASLKEMPPRMANLKNLQTLTDFVLSENDGSRIVELGELQLHGSLCISGLDYVADVGDAKKANLKKKECLDELILRWIYGKRDTNTKQKEVSDHKDAKLIRQWPPKISPKDHTTKQKQVPDHSLKPDETIREKELLDALKPHTCLRKLEIYGLRGANFPDWVAHRSFHDIVKVTLLNCTNCALLPPFGQLPSLKELEIQEVDGLTTIGDEFCGSSLTSRPFPFLEKLTINGMDSWENWSFTSAYQEGGVFPRLKKLDIQVCDKLNVGLPAGCLPSLESILIEYCDSMAEIFPTSQLQVIDTTYPSLEYMKIRSCQTLESFAGSGLPSSLKEVEITGCQNLTSNRLSWNLQRLSCLHSLSLGGTVSKEVVVEDSFPEEELLPSSLNDLRIESLRNLIRLNSKGLSHLTNLGNLSIILCKQLECLPEQGLPVSLSSLDIYECPLLSVRCQRGLGEDWPKIQHVPRIVIDFKEI